jgi:hypothetical protein
MIMKALLIASVLAGAAITMPVESSGAPECAGSACGAVSVKSSGSCYTVSNTGSRNVKVALPLPSAFIKEVARTLSPGESWVPQYGIVPGCVASYLPPYRANFE